MANINASVPRSYEHKYKHSFKPHGSDSFKCEWCGLVCDNTDFPSPEENICPERTESNA